MISSETNPQKLVTSLTLPEKIGRSLDLISKAYAKYGDNLVVANSLGKDSCVVWHLAKQVSANIKGFIVTTRFKPQETKSFMARFVADYPETKIFQNNIKIADNLHASDPDLCCQLLKVTPTKQALSELNARCWITGLRCTEGRTRTEYHEVETRDEDLVKLNPILIWEEREIWQYLAMYNIEVNELYQQGYRSLGCSPCTKIATGDERSGRWIGTSKCGGECGIHTQSLR